MSKIKISKESYDDLIRCNTNDYLSQMMTTSDRNGYPSEVLNKAISFAAAFCYHFFEVLDE